MAACAAFIVFLVSDSSFFVTASFSALPFVVLGLALRRTFDLAASASLLALASPVPVTDSFFVISLDGSGLAIILFPVTGFVPLALVFVFKFSAEPCSFVALHEAVWAVRIVGRLLMVRFVPLSIFTPSYIALVSPLWSAFSIFSTQSETHFR